MRNLVSMICGLICLSLSAQGGKDLVYRNFKPFVNLSVSAGVGAGHAYHFTPSLDLRIGRYTFGGSVVQFGDKAAMNFQAEADLRYFNTKGKFVKSISLCFGLQEMYAYPWTLRGYHSDIEYWLLGYNLFRKGKRWSLNFKLGAGFYHSGYGFRTEKENVIPYGSISYRLYVARLRLREMPARQAGIYFADTFLRKYLNLGISYGLGGVTPVPLFPLPSLSLRVGRVTWEVGLGFLPYYYVTGGMQVKADLYRLHDGNKYRRHITGTAGVLVLGGYYRDYFPYLLGGWSATRKKGRLVFDLKAGAGTVYSENDLRYVIPYLQVSGTAFMMRFLE